MQRCFCVVFCGLGDDGTCVLREALASSLSQAYLFLLFCLCRRPRSAVLVPAAAADHLLAVSSAGAVSVVLYQLPVGTYQPESGQSRMDCCSKWVAVVGCDLILFSSPVVRFDNSRVR